MDFTFETWQQPSREMYSNSLWCVINRKAKTDGFPASSFFLFFIKGAAKELRDTAKTWRNNKKKKRKVQIIYFKGWFTTGWKWISKNMIWEMRVYSEGGCYEDGVTSSPPLASDDSCFLATSLEDILKSFRCGYYRRDELFIFFLTVPFFFFLRRVPVCWHLIRCRHGNSLSPAAEINRLFVLCCGFST